MTTLSLYSFSALFIFFCTCSEFTSARKLPNFIPVCKKSNPNYDQCLLNSLEAVRPYLPKGIPKIRFPPLEPLVIPRLDINRDLDNLKVKATLKDIKVIGASNFQIKNLKSNVNKLYAEGRVLLPHLYVTAEYDVDGRLLLVPLKGKGFYQGNLTDSVADVKGWGEIVKNSKGVEHLRIKNIQAKIRVGDHTSKFINKDNDPNNRIITQTASAFINQNRRQVLDIVMPIAEETAIAFAQQLGNNILKSIPASELLPE